MLNLCGYHKGLSLGSRGLLGSTAGQDANKGRPEGRCRGDTLPACAQPLWLPQRLEVEAARRTGCDGRTGMAMGPLGAGLLVKSLAGKDSIFVVTTKVSSRRRAAYLVRRLVGRDGANWQRTTWEDLADEDSTLVATTKVWRRRPRPCGCDSRTVGIGTAPRRRPPRLVLNLCGFHKGPTRYALPLDVPANGQSPG